MTTEAPTKINAYLVKIVERAHSSGAEHWYEATCLSLEGARKYMISMLDGYAEERDYPEDWDTEDMNGAQWPSHEIFSIENLTKQLEKNEKNFGYDTPIWGPESNYEAQAPIEFFIKKTVVYS